MQIINFECPCEINKPLKLADFSDLHADSPNCDRKRLIKDLDTCKAENRKLIFVGDLFDAIIHSDRKRFVPSTNEDNSDNQLNKKLDILFDILKPYADNIMLITRGNHEESIIKYNGIDLLEILVKQLNMVKTNGQIVLGDYQNFVRLSFRKNNKIRTKYDIFLHHGAGGNAPITKGMLDFNRIIHGVDADLVLIGHKHNAISLGSDPLMTVNSNNEVVMKNRQAYMTPSYTNGNIIDHNINFAERFYTHQSLPGYIAIDLIPYYKDEKYNIKPEISMRIAQSVSVGNMQNVLFKKKLNDRQNTK